MERIRKVGIDVDRECSVGRLVCSGLIFVCGGRASRQLERRQEGRFVYEGTLFRRLGKYRRPNDGDVQRGHLGGRQHLEATRLLGMGNDGTRHVVLPACLLVDERLFCVLLAMVSLT